MLTRRRVATALVIETVAWYLAAFTLGPFGRPACAAEAPPPAVAARILVVGPADDQRAAWTDLLTADGLPYDVDDTAPALVRPDGAGRYQGIVATGVLTPADDAAIDGYQVSHGVRRIDARPAAGATLTDLDGVTGQVTPAGQAWFRYLRGPVPIERAFGHLAAPAPGVTPLVAAPGGEPLVEATTDGAGRERLRLEVAISPRVLHWRLLGHGLVTWLTRGVHIGLHRWWFSVDVDDVFLANHLWDPATAQTDRGVALRMTPADMAVAARWSQRRAVPLQLGFNAFGRDASLCGAVLRHEHQLRWFNHTYSHLDMDGQSRRTLTEEIGRNVDWARGQHLPIRRHELVTGAHTGLANPDLPAALRANHIDWIGADASREPAQRRIGPALTVPRYPTNIYYDAATVEQDVAEYNDRYVTHCVASATTTCRTAPATWDEIVAIEARTVLGHVLANDPRIHYLHQSNLTGERIAYPLLDSVLDRYHELVRARLLVPTLTASGRALRHAAQWQRALDAGTVRAEVVGGTTLVVGTRRPVWVPLTVPADAVDGRGLTRYAGERSGWVRLTPGHRVAVRIS